MLEAPPPPNGRGQCPPVPGSPHTSPAAPSLPRSSWQYLQVLGRTYGSSPSTKRQYSPARLDAAAPGSPAVGSPAAAALRLPALSTVGREGGPGPAQPRSGHR